MNWNRTASMALAAATTAAAAALPLAAASITGADESAAFSESIEAAVFAPAGSYGPPCANPRHSPYGC